MGRPREPIELLMAKEKKHLTQEEINRRKEEEIKIEINRDNIIAPDYLSENLKKEFDKISEKLIQIGIMTELDNDCLARYLLSKQIYLKYTSLLTKEIKKENFSKIEKYMNIQDKAFKQCRASATDLGLSISSRCKLVMPKTKETPKENKFKRFKEVEQ